jgi:hypothetical protein
MNSKYTYLGVIAGVLAFIGLLFRYLMPVQEPYQSAAMFGLFLIGFIVFGYGYGDGWKWPVWLGTIIVMIAFILLANATVLWFILAIGLGAIAYSLNAKPRSVHQ